MSNAECKMSNGEYFLFDILHSALDIRFVSNLQHIY